MSLPKNKAFWYGTYLVARLAIMAVNALSWSVLYRLADLGGWVLYTFDRKHRERAMEHLRASFPHWTDDQCRRVARTSFRNMAAMAMELVVTTRVITPETWASHVKLTNMARVIRLMIERKTGVVLVTGHYGNWEIAGYVTAVVGLPTVTVARRIDNPYMNDYLMGVRERAGQRIIYKKGASEVAPSVLDDHGVLALVCDQDAGSRGVFVNFMGRRASTFKSAGLLAMRHQAPVALIYSRRTSNRFTFEIGCARLIEPHEWAEQADPLRWITQQYTAALEQVVRRNPEQYFWLHRRWKSRPRAEIRRERLAAKQADRDRQSPPAGG